MIQKYEVRDESYVLAKNPLAAFDPYATTMKPIVQLAKAAGVPLWAGYSGGPMFVEYPLGVSDRAAFDQLAADLGLVEWSGRIA